MPQVFDNKQAGLSHFLMVESYLAECDLPCDGLIARSSKDYLLELMEKLEGHEDEDILVGIALIKAMADWRAMTMLNEFDEKLHRAQMEAEIQRISKFLTRQYRNKFFLGERPKRSEKEYTERLTPYSYIHR